MAKVSIVMGSDSDMPVMAKAAAVLDEMGVSYEMRIISAHREVNEFFEYAKTAEERGIKVIIAGAGMAAHLPGMCAAIFPLPVIGIPMHTTSLGGRDSLYSIVQMPSGIPVATVAIDGGANAAILACKILAVSDDELLAKLRSLLGGRAAEQVVFGVQTNGASGDIQSATAIARHMVCLYGMSDELGLMATASVRSEYLEGQATMDCSPETAAKVDTAIQKLITQCYEDAKATLTENRSLLDEVSEFLLTKETITGEELMAFVEADKKAREIQTEETVLPE